MAFILSIGATHSDATVWNWKVKWSSAVSRNVNRSTGIQFSPDNRHSNDSLNVCGFMWKRTVQEYEILYHLFESKGWHNHRFETISNRERKTMRFQSKCTCFEQANIPFDDAVFGAIRCNVQGTSKRTSERDTFSFDLSCCTWHSR